MSAASEPTAWSNWADSTRCRPARIEAPASESALLDCLDRAWKEGWGVRAAGTGHSFSPLCTTDGLLLSLENLSGVRVVSREPPLAEVEAGTKLWAIGDPLQQAGLAMINLGDIDRQAIAGALATGTHGTGRTLGNLSSSVVGLRIATADGRLFECSESEDPELWRAARVSLGALGVITRVRLRVRPAYCLHERIDRVGVDAGLAALEAWIDESRHFEFWWYPSKDQLETKHLREVEGPPDPLSDERYQRIDWSHRVLPSERELRFVEMEYSVPAEAGPACFRAVRERMQARHPDVVWPVEYRRVAPDDAFLSMAEGRDTVTISVHQGAGLPFEAFFADVEPIFWEHRGRPHWGKLHGLDATALRALYPQWDAFQRQRDRLDPERRMTNAYLRRVLDG